MTDLKNKNALITGAGKGIGKAIAIALAKEGVNVILVSRTQADVDQLADETSKLGVKSLALSADVSDINSINNAVEKACDAAFGDIPVLRVDAADMLGLQLFEPRFGCCG